MIIQDSRKRSVVKEALNFIRARTCLEFTESATATNRIRVFNGAGCYATIGMVGGVQDLSMGNGCEAVTDFLIIVYSVLKGIWLFPQVGIAAHEFAHALGIWHMQMRNDRDNFVQVDLSSVPANMLHNYIKLPPSRTINYTPYEYGSYMHYDARSRIWRSSLQSAREFDKSIKSGPFGCGEVLTASDRWQVKQFTFGDAAVRAVRDTFTECNHWIEAPAGKRIQIRITSLQNSQCHNGCTLNAIEPKIRSDKTVTNPRIVERSAYQQPQPYTNNLVQQISHIYIHISL
ncbi:astacin [Necator americanus]|uniref:Metalloendopeptidase n=1 Tax=Necator americanus TaxID=51031 RepID=W2TLG1_NECAM|nr:astacin [Necator americanus]ETN82469.1 astacin [Necator americanus]